MRLVDLGYFPKQLDLLRGELSAGGDVLRVAARRGIGGDLRDEAQQLGIASHGHERVVDLMRRGPCDKQRAIQSGTFDLNLAYGQSQAKQLDSDINPPMDVHESLIKSQTGISAGVVYHATENVHLDLDFLNGKFAWYKGETQTVNYLNTGLTRTW